MAKTREPRGGAAGRRPPQSAEQALARARDHGRAAAAETALALQALLDAATLATSGAPAAAQPVLGQAARMLESLAADFAPGDGKASESLLRAVAEALDAEIARWEKRAQDDSDARAVLRAFLGLRELLWELGVRHEKAEPDSDKPPRPRQRTGSPRVQRVRVEG